MRSPVTWCLTLARGPLRILAVFGALLATPVSASAHGGHVQPTDPSANSPAGVIYAIPLDTARQDAAPHFGAGSIPRSGGGTGSGLSSGGPGTSSFVQPGTSPSRGPGGESGAAVKGAAGAHRSSGASPGQAGKGSAPVLVPGGEPGSLVHSANGYGSSPAVPAFGHPASPGLGAVQSSSASGPLVAILLAAVVISVGGFVGVRAWR